MCHVLVIEDAGASSIDMAATQRDAIAAAQSHPPALIMSDVQLAEGTGPMAVQAIIADVGEIPVIFVTGTPEACQPRGPGMVVLAKPIDERTLAQTFRQMAPLAPG